MARARPIKAQPDFEKAKIDLFRILADVGEAAYVWDVASDRLDWTDNARAVLGLPAGVEIGSGVRYAALFDVEALTTRREAVFGSKEPDRGEGVAFEVDYPLTRGGRMQKLWIEDRGRWRAGQDGRPATVVGVVRRLGPRYEASEKLAGLARFDPLTGQLSRMRLIEVAAAALASGARMQTATSFVLATIVNLGAINEAYGFDVGDIALVEISRRLRASMRGGDTLGRHSSSTFGMVLQECDRSDLEVAARRFAASIHDQPIVTPAGPIAARVAVGAVVAPRHARDVDELVSRARFALSRAAETPSAFHIYAPDPEREAARRANMRLADELVEALGQRKIRLALQPVFRSTTDEVCWHEALVRIVAADGSVVSGGPLASAAEEVGLIHMLDRRVLDLAITHLSRNPEARLAINVSAATTADEAWTEALENWARLRPDVAERLLVEITETAAIADLAVTARFVRDLKSRGIRVAIDDFGTGHSSFRALKELEVDLVKIDGAFVRDLASIADSGAFVRALLTLARELGFETVAEQVESDDAAELLRDWGATYLQGDSLGPPQLV